MPEFILAATKQEYEAAGLLFKEYAAWLNIDLGFQNFEKEMQELDKMYSLPQGGIILCKKENQYIGCVGVRKIDTGTAEMKRMWVKTNMQGNGIGRELLNKAILLARECGYQKVRLDTLNSMIPAMTLYQKNGFIEIPPYYNNPDERAVYFEKSLGR